MRLFLLSLLFLSLSVPSFSKSCYKYTNGVKHVYRCPEQSKVVKYSWDTSTTRQNGKIVKKEIVRESVCVNYNLGSLERKDCLKLAKKEIKKRCKEYKKRFLKAPNSTQKNILKIDKDMYCNAESVLRFLK